MKEQKVYLISLSRVSPRFREGLGGYIPEAHGFPEFYKIGIATDPRNRMSQMGTGTPDELELVTTVEANDAEGVESELHRLYRWGHVSGEWFKLLPNAVNSLEALDHLAREEVAMARHERELGAIDHQRSLYVRVEQRRQKDADEQIEVHTTH